MNRRFAGLVVCGSGLLLLAGCGVKRADYATANMNLNPDAVQVWHSPIVTTPEMSTSKSSGSADKTYILGIPIMGDSVQGERSWIWDNAGQRQLGGLAAVAAGRAIDDADSDGLYLTRIGVDRTGFPPFYYNIEYTATGYPVTVKDTMTVDPHWYAWEVFADDEGQSIRTAKEAPSAFGGFLSMFTAWLPF